MIKIVFAQDDSAKQVLQQIISAVVNPIITLFFLMAISVFTYGIFQYIRNAEDSAARKKGQDHMLWGIVGLFIMISVFAIIKLLMNTIGVDGKDIWVI
jgi:uncharacterized membrane protein YidH (DUF202 family)